MSIDGAPQATIDLYAPDPNNDSVPVYSRTFDTVGTHTITDDNRDQQPALQRRRYLSGRVPGIDHRSDGRAGQRSRSHYPDSGWAEQTAAQASGGSMKVSSQAGDSASYTFTGQQVTLVGRLCPACGEADVYVDGQYATRIDGYGYRGAEVWQAAVFEESWGHPGRHTIKVVVTGTKNINSTGVEVDLDAIQVRAP